MMDKKSNTQHWKLNSEQSGHYDPLLQCLITLTKIFKKPFSAEALTAGLPQMNDTLNPELFVRAAKRANITAKVYKYSLDDISQLLLPAVVLLKDHKACILGKVDKKGTFHLIEPSSGSGIVTLSKSELEEIYTGYAIFVKPEYYFDRRGKDFVKYKSKHWYLGTVLEMLPIYGEVLVASFFINLFALASPLFIMNVYDRVVPNNAIETLWVLATGVIVVFLFDFIMRTLRGYFLDNASKKIDTKLSTAIFGKILGIKMDHLPKSVGTLTNLVQSFESFREFMTSAVISLLIDLPFISIFIVTIWSIGGSSMASIPIIAIPIVITLGFLIQIPLNNLVKKNHRVAAEKQATLIESLNGIETIKGLAAEGTMQHRWEKSSCQSAVIGTKLRVLSNFGVNASTFVQHMCTVSVIILGVYKIGLGELTSGGLIACTILTGRATAPIAQIAGLITRFFQSKTSLIAINKLMAMPSERIKGHSPLQRPQTKGEVEFIKVNFAYPDQQFAALSEVSFKIKPGERVGIIGRIGSGKSTIQKLIAGLYQPGEGKILVDGTDLHQMDPTQYRRQIAYIGQDNTLFYGTIKDNIALNAPYVDDEIIVNAAKLSGLDNLIKKHPEGFDMIVEERGKNLSGGQKQMIAISRAFLHEPNLILLDEPTNSMDDTTSDTFKKNLIKLLSMKKTMILVTHKGSMLDLVDRLIIVDSGKIMGDGPKEEILAALKAGDLNRKSKKPKVVLA